MAGGVVVFGMASGAGADCSGPTIEHTTGTVDRGEPITITGEAFGDNCYDTGPPPPGEDVLGKPLKRIEIVFVQGGAETVAARGDADRDFGFEIDVKLPADLQPGDVTVEARWANGGTAFNATTAALVVSDAPAAPNDPEVGNFGGAGPTESQDEEDDSTPIGLYAGAAATAIVIGGAAATLWFRRAAATR